VTFWVNPPASRYTPGDGPAIVERLLTRVQQVPGVLSATVNRCAPLSSNCARTTIFFPGRENDSAPPTVGRHYVSADYFQTLGIPLRDGRALTNRDRAGGRPVAVINEAAAQRFWPDENPIGKRVWFGSGTGFTDPTNPVEVVGVVGDVKYGALDEPRGPDFYTSYLQFTYPDTMMVVRIAGTPASIVGSLRRAVASVDPGLPIYDVQTLDDRIAQTLSRPRFNASVVTLFAAAALLLAAGGVYAVMAYSVSSRMHEIGIRLALGADATRVLRLVLGEGARLAGLGAAVGIAAAIVIARLMRSVLFGIADSDPVVMSSTVMIMFAVAIAAALVPARRASAIDPVAVLRRE